MSGETEENVSGWKTDTLHAHMNALFEAVWRELALLRDRLQHDFRLQAERMDRNWREQELRTKIALDAHDEALNVARETSRRETDTATATATRAVEAALETQREATRVQQAALEKYDARQNEWRGSLNDLGTRAMPRTEAEAAIQRATERIQELVLSQTALATRTEVEAAVRSVRAELASQQQAADVARTADRDRTAELTQQLAEMRAATAAAADKVKGIYAALGVGVTLIVAAIAVFNFISAR